MKRSTLGLLLVFAFALAPSLALAQGNTHTVPGDFATIQLAIDDASVLSGDKIIVGSGYHAGATVTKAVEITGEDGAVINDGPLPWGAGGSKSGFFFVAGGSGSGATISHLRFEVEFPVFSRGADDVTVTHNLMMNANQGITNWRGSRWNITHNEIIDLRTNNGGGIGILVGSWTGGIMEDNVLAHNKISGTLHVLPGDGGGYNGTGIVLYADFRWGAAGAERIAYNRVVKNKVGLTSDTPGTVDVVAIELTDSRDELAVPEVIHHNAIGFNDLRDTAIQIALTPETLGTVNAISRNLGENRGHGLHPSVFGPRR